MASPFHVPGPCGITWGTVPLSLGVSKGGVTIRTRTTWTPMTHDAYGTEPADFIFTGKAAQVELVGLDTVALKAAALWNTFGGLCGSGGAAGMPAMIGALASVLGQALTITERDGASQWIASYTVPTDPDTLLLASTTETVIPITFLVVPDALGKLFSTVPAYII